MRKLIKCHKCGRLNPQKRTTCSVCDTELRSANDSVASNEKPHKLKVCPACGDLGDENQRKCAKCGFQPVVESSSKQAKTEVSRQSFYVQPVKSSLSEISETAADSREDLAIANPWVRSDVIRNTVIVVALLVILFFVARNCANFT